MNFATSIRLFACIGMATLVAANASAAGNQVVKHFDFQPGHLLSLDFRSGGSITIVGWDQPGIEVTYGDHEQGLDAYQIEFENNDNNLSINAKLLKQHNSSNLQFSFKAPREMVLDFYSGGGNLDLSGVAGEFSGRTGGGSLLLDDVTGEVDLRTGGGRILVQNSAVDGEMRTGGGKVLVENVIGDLQARSGGGSVTYKNVRSGDGTIASPNQREVMDATGATVLISNQGGQINVDSAPEGADVYTGGGKIRVTDADRFVAAKTGGGDIQIDLSEGWVKAQTGAGEIEVTVAQNALGNGDINLISGNGDIVLTLPSDFSMDLSVELGVTNNTRRQYSLRSDFDVAIETTDEWDYSRGTPRKYTFGTANLNGGGHQVTVHTTNGNVTIKRGR